MKALLIKFILIILILIPVSILSYAQPVKGGNWANLMFNYNDTRYQANSTINSSNIANITEIWHITSGTVTSTPIVVNGSVYFDDWNGGVYSANILTGSTAYPNWHVNLGGNSISGTPAVANGRVYVALGPDDPQQPTVYALSQANGDVLWETHLPTSSNELYASPIVLKGILYVGVAGDLHDQEINGNSIGAIYALNTTNGNIVWAVNTMIGNEGGAGVWGSVAIDPILNSIYFGTSNPYIAGTNSLYGYSIMSLNATNGNINWYNQIYKNPDEDRMSGDYDFGSSANLFSVEINGVIYNAIGLGNKNGWYYVLNRVNGENLENISVSNPGTPDGIRGIGGFVYLSGNSFNPEIFVDSSYENVSEPNMAGVTEAFYPSNSTIAWRFYTPGELTGSVSIIPGAVLFGDSLSNFYALNTSNGNIILHKNFNSSILAGITPASKFIFVPLAGVQLDVPQGIDAFAIKTNATQINNTSTSTIPATTTIPQNTNSILSYISLTASNTVLDAGQIETLTVRTANSTTPNLTVQIDVGHSFYSFYFVNGQTGLPSAPIYGINGKLCSNIEELIIATCTFKEAIGNFSYGVGAQSSSRSVNSTPIKVNVYGDYNNTNGNVPIVTITPSSNSLTLNRTETFTIAVTGGIGPFNVQIYNVSNKSNFLVGSVFLNSSNNYSNTIQFKIINMTGTYAFRATATDTGTNLPFQFNSTKNLISITTQASTGNIKSIVPNTISITDEILIAIIILLIIIIALMAKRNSVIIKQAKQKK
ncbi:MAG: PQQ-binding-like beta-propeller repeat protein [Candidatus Micrarchaeaceae archaeon]